METRSRYSSAVRAKAAGATRRAIVAAAGELFVERGYAATTIDAVAERAGVGRKTVFASVGGKGALLKLVWDWTLAGDDEPIPMAERPAVLAMLAERDPARLVRMWVEMLLDVGGRSAPIGAVVFAAADVDAEVRALREVIRRESFAGATAFVTHLAEVGGLRADLPIERAADACWAVMSSLLMNLLVDVRGWPMADYGDWLVQVVSTTLLEPAGPRPDAPLRITNDPMRGRYLAMVGDRVAGYLAYERTNRLLVLTHTEVESGFDDRGVADALARRALADVAADGPRRVLPVCPYITWWIARHPEHAPLLYRGTDAE